MEAFIIFSLFHRVFLFSMVVRLSLFLLKLNKPVESVCALMFRLNNRAKNIERFLICFCMFIIMANLKQPMIFLHFRNNSLEVDLVYPAFQKEGSSFIDFSLQHFSLVPAVH